MYDIFAKLLKERNVTAYQVHKATGVAQSSLSDWKNGKSSPKTANMMKLAEYFGVSLEYLMTGEQKEKPAAKSDGLTDRDKRDIARDLEEIMAEIENRETVMFDGDPATDAAKETLRNAIAMGLEYAKKVNKETYTPKKYRKEE